MEPKKQFRKCCSDVTDKFSKSLKDAVVLAEQSITELDVAKEAVNDARAAFKSSFARRSNSLFNAIAGRRRSRQNRSEHLLSLYNESKSTYTRQRIRTLSFTKPEGPPEVVRKRQASLPDASSSFRGRLCRLKDIRENSNPLAENQSMQPPPDERDGFVHEQTSVTANSCNPVETPARMTAATKRKSCDQKTQSSTGNIDSHASTLNEPSSTGREHIPAETHVPKTDRCTVNSINHVTHTSAGPGKQLSESTVDSIKNQWFEHKTASSTERRPIETTLKFWMRLNDETMRDYLKDLQKRSPNAYVLDLLKHRLEDNINDKHVPNDISKTDPIGSCDSGSEAAKERAITERYNHCGILNRNVIVIARELVGSPHPKRRFFTKSDISKKDMLNVRKRTSGNVFNKGNVIGTLELAVRFFPVSEQLVLSIRHVQFVDDYQTDREFVYITTVVEPTKGNQSPITSKSTRLKRRSRRLDIGEDISLQNFGVIDCQDGTARFTVYCYKKWIRRTHICLAEAKINISESVSSGPGTITAKLIRP